jgi:4a-hydroxytetrahydrobiopterin dehydratase
MTRRRIIMARLSDSDIAERLTQLSGWSRDGDAIRKQFTFAGFPDAIAFVVRIAFDAEAADHHPDLTINYRRVTVSFSTHSEGGVTEKDFRGAGAVEKIAQP